MEEGILTKERKGEIDGLTRYEMCQIWRFSKTGNWMLTGACGQYFKKRLFDDLGGFTPAISKRIRLERVA